MTCDCESVDQCKYQMVRETGGRLFKICNGTSGLPENKRQKYQSLWAGDPQQPTSGAAARCTQCPGSELSKLLSARGYQTAKGCGCKSKINKMNGWGPDGCRERIDEITDWLVETAKEKGWILNVVLKTPGTASVARNYIHKLVIEAIEMADRKVPEE